MPKAIVTGGAGFIGSNLVDRLLTDGWSVVAVDNLLTGSRANIQHLSNVDRFEFVKSDVEDMPVVPCDAVFHLASPASPTGYGRYPLETLRANSQGTWRALEVARASNARFLVSSTSEVYGDPLEHPQSESYFGNVDPIGPRSCYDEGKRFGEALTVSFAAEHDLDARIVRIFNCYGPRNALDDGRMVPTFAGQALRGEPLTIYGDGAQTRSLCFVDDLVEGLIDAAMMPGTRGEVFNLGQPREHSVLEFARMIVEIAGSDSPLIHLDPREGEIERRKPDVRKAEQILEWRASTPLETGLTRTIAWYRTELGLTPAVA
jgi:nucleoside-diphosphate-sugar epimerase